MKIVITIDTNENEVKVVTDEQKSEQTIAEKETEGVNSISQYARYFDEVSRYYNICDNVILFLQTTEHSANELLKKNKHLYLNDVYEMLGLPVTDEGDVVGWIYDEKNPIGDNFVDFGIFEYHNWKALRGIEDHKILLDFNVDGYIGKS